MSEQTPTSPTPYAFIPSPLVLEDRPDLAVLPLNVLYMSLANVNGADTSGTALYEPAFVSYRDEGGVKRLRYYNKYSEADYIDISYSADDRRYQGVKYVQGYEVVAAYGADWKTFFVHLTLGGLSKGEGCLFEPIEPAP